jgi:hypothetical protein
MRHLLAVLSLAACGGDLVVPIEQPLAMHDEPLFEVPGPDLQIGTVLVYQRRSVDRIEELALARFEPSGDRGYYSLADTDGDCRLYTVRTFCDPECEGIVDQCIEGACVPYPRFVAAGELAIDGLGDRVALTFENDIQRYESEDTLYVARLNGPAGGLLAEGAAIAVTAGGSDQVPAFTGQVAGTDPVRSHLQPGEVLQLPSDGDVRLEWRPGPAGARVRLVLRTSETGHGMPPNEKLVCDVADQGSLVIPGSLIGQLPEMRWLESGSGYAGGLPLIPSGLIRYRTSTVDTDAGRVELIAATETLFWAIH